MAPFVAAGILLLAVHVFARDDEGGSVSCLRFQRDNNFTCVPTVEFDPCQVGGCPLDPGRQNGWMVRAEPCGDFWHYDPAWAGAHITMSHIEHYDEHKPPLAKFLRAKSLLESKHGRNWMPDGFILKHGTCASSNVSTPSNVFPWTRLYVGSSYLEQLGSTLSSVGFHGIHRDFHVTLGYAAGISIPWADYEKQPSDSLGRKEFEKITHKLRNAPWRLVLLKMNNETQMIEKHDEVLLQDGGFAGGYGYSYYGSSLLV
jgi:hypothetical protein